MGPNAGPARRSAGTTRFPSATRRPTRTRSRSAGTSPRTERRARLPLGPSSSENAAADGVRMDVLNFLGINFQQAAVPEHRVLELRQPDGPAVPGRRGRPHQRVPGSRTGPTARRATRSTSWRRWSHEDGGHPAETTWISIQRPESRATRAQAACTPADANPPVPSTQTGIVFPPGDIGNLIG